MRVVILVLLAILVVACGQKGPLVLPEPPAQAEPDEEEEAPEDEDRRGT